MQHFCRGGIVRPSKAFLPVGQYLTIAGTHFIRDALVEGVGDRFHVVKDPFSPIAEDDLGAVILQREARLAALFNHAQQIGANLRVDLIVAGRAVAEQAVHQKHIEELNLLSGNAQGAVWVYIYTAYFDIFHAAALERAQRNFT